MISKETPYIDTFLEIEDLKAQELHEEAIALCETILHDDLECVEAYEEIADNYLSLKEYKKAVVALQKALKLDPKSANAHYLLGFAYSATSKYDKSIECLETADSLEPNHPEILRCLGWSIFNSGRRKQGLILLERAQAMANEDILILGDLGICYLNEKNFDKAEEIFEKMLSIEPQNDKARECLKACNYFKQRMSK